MANITISSLPVASASALTDLLVIVQGGVTKQLTNALLFTNPTLVAPALGTPASGTLTNCTDLPISTGVNGLGTGVATFLGTPSSANLSAALTTKTGTGSVVFDTSPTLITPILGTPTSGTLTNCTGLPIVAGTIGALSVARGGTGIGTVEALTGSSTINTTDLVTTITTTSANAYTLADGVAGQLKSLVMIADSGDATVTVTNFGNGSTITLNDVGDSCTLVFAGTKWWILSNNGCTIA